MSPAAVRPVNIDRPSVVWAYDLGLNASQRGGRWTQSCPFRDRTPHMTAWLVGWRGRRIEDAYKKIYKEG